MKALPALVVLLLGVQDAPSLPAQTDWRLGGPPGAYAMESSSRATDADGATITVRSLTGTPPAFGAVSASIPALSLRGRRVVLSGELQTRDVANGASLWMRVDEGQTPLLLDNGAGRRQTGSSEWSARRIQLPVPPEATQVVFGVLLEGAGTVMVRRLRIEAAASPTVAEPDPEAIANYLRDAIAIVRKNALKAPDVDWAQLEPRLWSLAAGSRQTEDVHPVISYMLSRLGDRHSFLMPAAQSKRFASGTIANPRPDIHVIARERVGYIKVPPYAGAEAQSMRAYTTDVHTALGSVYREAACGFVVDLRGNGGGNMWPMLAGLRPLLGGGSLGTFEAPGRSTPPWVAGRSVGVDPPEALAALESTWVGVLTDSRTGSSGEAVAVAFRGRPRTRSFGQPTAGLSTANSSFPLSDGAVLLLTTAVFADRTGRRYGVPIEPDEVVAEADGRDAPLEAAVSWLRRLGGCDLPGDEPVGSPEMVP